MRSVRFMACAMSAASLAFTAGAQYAAAFPEDAASKAAKASVAGNIPVTKVQWWEDSYRYGLAEWKHAGWGGDWGYGGGYYGGFRPCCLPPPPPCCLPPPPPCCLPPPPPPPPPPCCPNHYIPPRAPFVPAFGPLK